MAAIAKKRHPIELKWLFSIEMWERFGFYLLLGIFTLFLMDSQKGGFGYKEEYASEIYGTFLALCYFTPFIGGMVAERLLGFRKTILLGAILMASGYFLLATITKVTFYGGLLCIIVGNGFFKPNISSVLGKLYPDGSALKTSGFNIFYVGINIAGFFCNFIAAFLRHRYGWDFAFAGAGVGMCIAIILLLLVYRRLKPVDDIVAIERQAPRDPNEVSFKYMAKWVLPPVVFLAGVGYWQFGLKWAFLMACVPILVFYFKLWATAKKEEKGPLGALLVMLVVAMPFFTIYGLNGAALTFWAQDYTEREFRGNAAINWTMDTFRFDEEAGWDSYYFNKDKPHSAITAAPQLGHPKVRLLSTEILQSVNPFFIVTLIPLIELLFGYLKKRNKKLAIPTKIGIGLVLAAVSMVVMIFAVYASQHGAIKVSIWWVIWTYFFITAAECFVSPVGLILVSEVSPKRFTAVMMGGFFLISIAMGLKLAGVASGLWNTTSHVTIFISLAIFALVFAVAVFRLSGWLDQYMPKPKPEQN